MDPGSTYQRVYEDYKNNFMPRKEILEILSLIEIDSLLKDKKLHEDLRITWHLKFYITQLVKVSVQKLLKQASHDAETTKRITSELRNFFNYHKMFGTNETRAILFRQLITYASKLLSAMDLYEAFAGTSIYDDYCAELAFALFKKRKHN